MYPGVKVHKTGERLRYLYGAPMTPGMSEAQAAAGFLSAHSNALRAAEHTGELEFRESWSLASRDESFRAFGYRQLIHGKEVEGSDIRIVVTPGALYRVVFAAARLAGTPTSGSEYPVMPSEGAILVVQSQSGVENLTIESPPDVVVLLGSNRRPDAWVWRVRTRQGEGPTSLRRTYFVDTIAPQILKRQDHYANFDPPTTGEVSAPGMPVGYPWYPHRDESDVLVTHKIPGIRVTGQIGGGSAYAYTDAGGNFSLTYGTTSQGITITSSFEQASQGYIIQAALLSNLPGEWVNDTDVSTVGSTVDLNLANGDMGEEFRVAQVDTAMAAHRARNFFTTFISTTASGLSLPLHIFVSDDYRATPCKAFANDGTNHYAIALAAANETANCWNLASHSVIGHEYGHVALFMLHSTFARTGFHEGFADTYANLLNDDSVQGRAHHRDDSNIRDDPTASHIDCDYPAGSNHPTYCDCAEHLAGQLLSGPWVRISDGMKNYYGNSTGLARTRTLFGQWAIATMGGDGVEDCDSPHPGNLAELLGLPQPGTQQHAEDEWAIFCAAFANHNMFVESGCP